MNRGRMLPSFNNYDMKGKVITETGGKEIGEKCGADNFIIHRSDLQIYCFQRLIKIRL